MKQWKKWAGILLSLSLAAACIPKMDIQAASLGADQTEAQSSEIQLGDSQNKGVYQGDGNVPRDRKSVV